MKKEEKLELQRLYSLLEDLEIDVEDVQRNLVCIKGELKGILKDSKGG